ncbi:hypothetical protein BCR35DRAFT_329834 [Leucosporidium creatinivorum]|uniref:PWWP domain-containing protein n=1 Tax=Leucosporidium creatinivorum TaxID=106004 RepID=A0A1Y2FZ10_9BASI|nr:hypothetical protein BCR35DRAFT_329834 [Leucosporidium creatinivorum]
MATKSTKKRGRPPTKKKAAAAQAAPPKRDEFRRKKDAVAAIKELLKKLGRAGLPSRDEDAPMHASEVLFTRLLTKEPLCFDVFNQGLSTWWSNRSVSKMRVVAEDVESSEPVKLFVQLVRRVLEGGYGASVDKTKELKLEDLNSMFEWCEAVWIEVEKLADEEEKLAVDDAASPSQLASPEPSDAGSPSRVNGKAKSKSTTSKTNKKPVSKTYSSSSEDEERDQLASDDDAPAPAQSTNGKKKVGVKEVKVEVKVAVSKKKEETKVKATAKKRKAASPEDEEGASASRRSNRQPAHTQTAQEAVNSKPRYSSGDILGAKIRDGVSWPGAVMDDPNDGAKVHGKYSDGCYLVQLLPTKKRYWIDPQNLSALPSKSKRQAPSGLKSGEKADYQTALDLLDDDVRLHNWLNDYDGSESDSDENGQARAEEIVVDSDQEEELKAPAAKKARRS